MSATNHTANLDLPLFVDGDKPSWLGDFNGAMQKIDAARVTDASAAATMNATILSLQTQIATANAAITALTARVATLEGA